MSPHSPIDPSLDGTPLGESCYSIRYERRSEHSAARLWRAIAKAKELVHWMDYPARVELRVGRE